MNADALPEDMEAGSDREETFQTEDEDVQETAGRSEGREKDAP